MDFADNKKGYVAFDYDRVLAYYKKGQWPVLGSPIPLSIDRVRNLRQRGIEVRILTARVARTEKPEIIEQQTQALREWCLEHIGEELPIQDYKCRNMRVLIDDRAIQALPDTGTIHYVKTESVDIDFFMS